jgi:hypothetical protein
VAAHSARHVRQLRDARVAPVRADHEARAQPHPRAGAVDGLDAALGEERLDRATEDQLDARGGRRGLANERIEHLAAQVDAAAHARVGPDDRDAPARVQARVRAHPARRLDRPEQPEALERRHGRGLDEVPADALERLGVGPLLDEGHARAGAGKEHGRRAPGETRADDDRVVVHRATGVSHADPSQ